MTSNIQPPASPTSMPTRRAARLRSLRLAHWRRGIAANFADAVDHDGRFPRGVRGHSATEIAQPIDPAALGGEDASAADVVDVCHSRACCHPR